MFRKRWSQRAKHDCRPITEVPLPVWVYVCDQLLTNRTQGEVDWGGGGELLGKVSLANKKREIKVNILALHLPVMPGIAKAISRPRKEVLWHTKNGDMEREKAPYPWWCQWTRLPSLGLGSCLDFFKLGLLLLAPVSILTVSVVNYITAQVPANLFPGLVIRPGKIPSTEHEPRWINILEEIS